MRPGFWLIAVFLLTAVAVPQTLPDGMKQYYLVLLRKGPHRDHDAVTAQKLQEGHLANISRLSTEGHLLLAGPCIDDGDLRGIFILNAASAELAEKLLQSDPAIAAGRLRCELHPWLGPSPFR